MSNHLAIATVTAALRQVLDDATKGRLPGVDVTVAAIPRCGHWIAEENPAVLLEHMLPPLQAIRDRRRRFAEHPREILEIFHEGSKRARRTAMETMDQVRAAVKLEP